MSTIVWMLYVTLTGAFCMQNVAIQFPTEQACEQAKAGIQDSVMRKYSNCEPVKKSKETLP